MVKKSKICLSPDLFTVLENEPELKLGSGFPKMQVSS